MMFFCKLYFYIYLVAFSKTSGVSHSQGNANFPKMNLQNRIECFRNVF